MLLSSTQDSSFRLGSQVFGPFPNGIWDKIVKTFYVFVLTDLLQIKMRSTKNSVLFSEGILACVNVAL